MSADCAAGPQKKDWVNILFLTLTPVIGIFGTIWYTWQVGFEWWMLALLLSSYLAVGLSICAGYHRYFSHKSYECSPVVQAFYAIFGAMAAQNSILHWSSGHRAHHKYVDNEWDPYNIRRGLWWAHMVWIFYISPPITPTNVPDLEKNALVRWQNRWYRQIVILVGFGLPTLVGAYFGSPLGGLLWGGFLRIVVIHHTTFFVNSIAHHFGGRDFDADVSARDNWIIALLTLGEGYHSFHHRFPSDFRNGVRWFQWDPAKWFIRVLRFTGLAWDLRSTQAPLIEQVRMEVAVKLLETRLEQAPPLCSAEIRQRISVAQEALSHSLALWRQQAEERTTGVSKAWKETRRRSMTRLKQARTEWRTALRLLAKVPEKI